MTFFESLLILMLVAIVLLQVSRRLSVPYPSMLALAGVAEALVPGAPYFALDPEIVFLDEPTAGLDPIGATDFDHLIRKLQQTLGLTVYMVTHDLDTIFTVCDRVAVLADKKIVRTGSPTELQHRPNHPWIQEYFCGERARAASPGERPRIPA